MKKTILAVTVFLSVAGWVSCSGDADKKSEGLEAPAADSVKEEAGWRRAVREKKEAASDTFGDIEIGDNIEAATAFFNQRICPLTFDEGLMITGTTPEKNYVLCSVSVEESGGVTVADLKKAESIVKDEMRETFYDPDFLELVNVAAKNDMGLKYRLTGSTTKETYDVNFTTGEIKKVIAEMY